MKKKGKHNHTGPIHHDDMHDHLPPVGKDMHAHESHHAMNKEHDGAGAFATGGEEHDKGQHGGEGMAGNQTCC